MSSDKSNLVINLTPTNDRAMKPAELIKLKANQYLSLVERRAVTVLWHNAHRQKIKKGKTYTIPFTALATEGYNSSSAEMRQILKQLQRTLIETHDEVTGDIMTTSLLSTTIERGGSKQNGVLEYCFTDELFKLIKDSEIWGLIEIPVLMHLSSKYSISLFEQISQWAPLDYKNTEELTLDEFREMLAIEDGKYPSFGSLNKHVIKKSVSEINALAGFSITVVPIKEGKKVTRIGLFWRQKNVEEKKEAYAELSRHRSGRSARIDGSVELVEPVGVLNSSHLEIAKDSS